MKILRAASPLWLLISWLFFGAGLSPARAQLLGPELLVNSFTTGTQNDPEVAADGSGNFVVVWQSTDQDGTGESVFGQRFSSSGSPVGSEFPVNSFTPGNQIEPAVAAAAAGDFVVVWTYVDGGSFGVFGQRFDSAGSRAGSEFQVNSYQTDDQQDPDVAMDASGNFVVVWQSYDQDHSHNGVFGQRYDSAGNPVGSEFQVHTYTTTSQNRPAVAVDGSGNFIVVWSSGDDQDGSGNGLFGQRFNLAGSRVGSEFQINTYTTGDQGGRPSVAADSAGNFVVAWHSETDGSDRGVFGQRFGAAGERVGSEFLINSYTTETQLFPTVAMDGSGNFVMAWDSYGQDGSQTGQFGQQFDSAGSRVGSEFQINSHTTLSQEGSAVAAGNSGPFVVVWRSTDQDGSGTAVIGRQWTLLIFADGFELGNVCTWSARVGSGDVCPI